MQLKGSAVGWPLQYSVDAVEKPFSNDFPAKFFPPERFRFNFNNRL